MKKTFNIRYEWLLYSFVGLGILLSFIQFLYARSLWLDEAALALNIMERDYAGLTEPLSRNQVAPILFLWIEKFFTSVLGINEYGLRIFPLLCFWGAIFLFLKFLREITSDQKIILSAFAFFPISFLLISYSAEVKQYMTDVLVTLLLFYLTVKTYSNNFTRTVSLMLAGIFAIFVSNIAVIILTVCSIYLSFFTGGFGKSLKKNILVYLVWGAAFAFYYFRFIAGHPTTAMMQEYWGDAFMPLNPVSGAFWIFLYGAAKAIFYSLLSFFQLWPAFFLLFLTGLLAMIRMKAFKWMVLLLGPVIIHMVLSGLKLYPFDTRLILYQAPAYFTVMGFGVAFLYEKIKLLQFGNMALVAPALVLFIPLAFKFPIEKEEIKQSIAFVEKNSQEGDEVYLWRMSEYPLEFYRRNGVTDLSPEILFSQTGEIERAAAGEDRFFLVFTHIYPKPGEKKTKEEQIIAELSDTWTLEKKKLSERSSAYLFSKN